MKRMTASLGVAALAGGCVVGLLPATTAQAATVDLHATLRGSATYPNAHGWAEFERDSSTDRELEVTGVHLKKLAGKYVVVFANGHKVGKILVSAVGYAHREWETTRGEYVPRLSAGDPLRVRTTSGVLVLRGHF
jgi:hypothetical protein